MNQKWFVVVASTVVLGQAFAARPVEKTASYGRSIGINLNFPAWSNDGDDGKRTINGNEVDPHTATPHDLEIGFTATKQKYWNTLCEYTECWDGVIRSKRDGIVYYDSTGTVISQSAENEFMASVGWNPLTQSYDNGQDRNGEGAKQYSKHRGDGDGRNTSDDFYLLDTGLQFHSCVFFNNIPYEKYDVICYFNNKDCGAFTCEISNLSRGGEGITSDYLAQFSAGSGDTRRGYWMPALCYNDNATPRTGNIAIFKGNTARGFQIFAKGDWSLYLCAVQIVERLETTLDAEAVSRIGINFANPGDVVSFMDENMTAGVADHSNPERAAAQSNWNNVTGFEFADDPGNGKQGSRYVGTRFRDDSGREFVDMRMSLNKTWDFQNLTSRLAPDTNVQCWFADFAFHWGRDEWRGGDSILRKAVLNRTPVIAVYDVPYQEYDVYVYFSMGSNPAWSEKVLVEISNLDGSLDGVPEPSAYCAPQVASSREYVRMTGTSDLNRADYESNAAWLEAATENLSTGNYARFEKLTAKNFKLAVIPPGDTGIAGIQIVRRRTHKGLSVIIR